MSVENTTENNRSKFFTLAASTSVAAIIVPLIIFFAGRAGEALIVSGVLWGAGIASWSAYGAKGGMTPWPNKNENFAEMLQEFYHPEKKLPK